MNKIGVIGGGGHAKVIIDIIKKNGYKNDEIFILDDNLQLGTKVLDVEVKGKVIDCLKFPKETKFIIAIGNNKIREKIASEYKLNYTSFIHPKSIIGEDVKIGKGCVVMAGVVINSGSIISNHAIVNTSVSIDHDSKLEDFVHLSPGVHMGGTVRIGKRSWVGVGSSVKNNITIGEDVTIGVGSVVVKDIKEKGVYVGCPAKKLNKCME